MNQSKLTPLVVFIFSLFMFASCSNSGDSERNIQLLEEPAALQHDHNSDRAVEDAGAAIEEESPSDFEIKNDQPEKKQAKKIVTKPAAQQSQAVEQSASVSPEIVAPAAGTEEPEIVKEEPKVAEKKGMSGTAQGAIIGGAAGAVGGAIISKNKGTGALVGAAVGAAAGAVIGKQKDKKAQAREEDQKVMTEEQQ